MLKDYLNNPEEEVNKQKTMGEITAEEIPGYDDMLEVKQYQNGWETKVIVTNKQEGEKKEPEEDEKKEPEDDEKKEPEILEV